MDAVIVYGQSKTAFGWPEHVSETPVPVKPSPTASSPTEEEEGGESLPVAAAKPLSHLGR